MVRIASPAAAGENHNQRNDISPIDTVYGGLATGHFYGQSPRVSETYAPAVGPRRPRGRTLIVYALRYRFRLVRWLAVGLLSLLTAPIAQAAARSQASATLIEQHILAQQGLSIGLAQITLQSQGISFAGFLYPVGECNALSLGGSLKVLRGNFSPRKIAGRMQIFFDTACKKLYIDETVSFVPGTDHYRSSATYTLRSTSGAELGSFSLTGTLANISEGLQITGTTTFTPVDGSPPATFAYNCITLNNSNSAARAGELPTPPLPPPDSGTDCAAGIVQNFPAIGLATASITPVTLHFTLDSAVTFSQTSAARLMTGPIDSLSIRINPRDRVLVDGPATAYGRDRISGEAAKFNLFPPRPTKWVVKDTEHTAAFSIALTSDRTRTLSGTVGPLNGGTPLATLEVDQSGTGQITYSDGTKAAISSWVLSR